MRILNRLSAAFLLLDGCTKQPLPDASILVDGRRERIVRKGGLYILTGLSASEHRCLLSAPGYLPQERKICSAQEDSQIVLMQIAPHSPRLAATPHFLLRVTENGVPVSDRSVMVQQETPVPGLRIVAAAAKGSMVVQLSGTQMSILYQPLLLGASRLLLTAPAGEQGAFYLRQPLEKSVGEGETLRPFWELETDRDGTAALPVSGCFWQREECSFSFALGKKVKKAALKLPEAGKNELPLEF